MLLASLSDVKLFLEKSATDTSHDELLGMIIEYVSARIETFLNRKLSKEYRTKTFDVDKKKYFLDAYPIDSSANITVTLDNVVETINEDYYVWYDEGFVEFDYKPTYIEPKQIIITWLGGYAATTTSVASVSKDIITDDDFPDAIKFATILQTAFIYRNRLNVGVTSVGLPDGRTAGIFSGDLIPEVKSMLLMYRKPAGGNA